MKLDNFKKPAIYGVILVILIILIEVFTLSYCTNDLGCLALMFIFAFPAAMLGLDLGTYLSFFINILFYFLLGTIVGFLVERFKSKSK